LDVFSPEPPAADNPLLSAEHLIATPHIAGSTEEAQEIVGIRIVEQLIEYLKNGVAINAVNMPPMSPEQYKAAGPFIALAERLGKFAAHVAAGHPKGVRITYSGRIAEMNTSLLRNSALAGVLSRALSARVNFVNAMPIAQQRGLTVAESHVGRTEATDSIEVALETDRGVTTVTGAVVLDRPRLLSVDGIRVEIALRGRLIYMRNLDVPGVIGHVGTVLGRNNVNIANFSLGRQDGTDAGEPAMAVALVEVDNEVSDAVLAELKSHPAVKLAVTVSPGD
jgi:D-3-phosphoglycerate dehydrogenase